MIIPEGKPLFVHVPRTGGGSINLLARRNAIYKSAWTTLGHNARTPSFKYLKDYKLHSSIFIFAFVRNPWDRAVSAFKWLQNGGNGAQDRSDRNKYLEKHNNDFNLFTKDAFKNNLIFNQIHFKPQHQWLCNEDGQILVDLVGRFENLQEDLNAVFKKISLPPHRLPHKNKSNHKPYTEYYDDETKQIVAEKYAKDIEYFGYKFGE